MTTNGNRKKPKIKLLKITSFGTIIISIMVDHRREDGFTVVETIVALVLMSVFLTLLFQLFFSTQYQQAVVVRRAAAQEIARSNLGKITASTTIPLPACIATAGSANNTLVNQSAAGSIIATNAPDGTPTWETATLQAEPVTDTPMPKNTIQELRVFYPFGCGVNKPIQIVSNVKYGTEVITNASYIK